MADIAKTEPLWKPPKAAFGRLVGVTPYERGVG